MLTASYPTRILQAWEKKIGMLLVSEMLLANSSGGNKDGIGFGTLDGLYVKWEESAGEVVFTDKYNLSLQQLINSPFIAHVRAISTGVGAKEGAHPFKAGNILLAHNGTFTNYRSFLPKYQKDIGDKNPVDSHVITCMLAEAAGDGELTPTHIREVLEKVKGSFALLITDITNGNMWVVTGSNPLYVQHSGPLWLVNTSRLNLSNISGSIDGISHLLYEKDWTVGDIVRVEEYTINLLTNKGLTQVAELDKEKHTVAYTQFQGSHYGRSAHGGVTKRITSDEARVKAEWADRIINLKYIGRIELTLGCFVLLETEWWKAEDECLEVFYATMAEINDNFGSAIKRELWEELMSLTKQNAYSVVAAFTDIAFPYMLNTVEALRGFLSEIRKDLSDGNHIPIGDDHFGDDQC